MTPHLSTHPSTRTSSWHPAWEIVRFELQDSFRTRFSLIAFAVFLIVGLVIVHVMGVDLPFFEAIREAFGIKATKPGNLVPFANAPLTIMRIFCAANLFLIILTVGIFTDRATKDFASGVDGLLFTTPLKKWQFGVGRLIASCWISIFISLGLGLGILLAQSLPWMEPSRFAPFNLLAYLQPYVYLIIPNILIFGLLSFALGLLTRRPLAGYLGLVAILLLQFVLNSLLSILKADRFLEVLVNPLGTPQIEYTVQFWTKVEQNTLNVPYAPVIWLSRLLYLALGVAFLVWVGRRFSFSGSASRPNSRLEKLLDWAERWLIVWKARFSEGGAEQTHPASAAIAPKAGELLQKAPVTHPHYGFAAQLYDVWRIAALELKRLIWNPLTLTVLAISLIATGFLMVTILGSGASPKLPVTELVVAGLDWLLRFIAPLLIVFLAGDLVWREREVKVDALTDPLPVRSWVFVWGKLLALGLLLLLTLLLLTVGSLLAQTVNRYTHYQLGVYGISLFTITLVDLLLVAVLVITIQVLTNQKFLGYFLSAVLALVFLAGDVVPFFKNARLLQYGFRPKYYYSDISGYGRMLEPMRWFQGYWLAIALLLLCISALFWVRGVDTQPKQRWRIARQRFTRPMQRVIALSAIAALCLGGWIYYNTRILNGGTSIAEGQDQMIAYEKAYGSLRDAQPKITAIQLRGDLYPETDSRFGVKGTYTLQNQTQKAIDTILINVFKRVQVNQITINGVSGEQQVQHPVFQVYRLPLSSPLQPGASIEATFDLLRMPPTGFADDPGKYSEYVANGTNFLSTDFLPMVGFVDRLLVKDPQKREQAGLPKLDPAAEQARVSQFNFNHPDTDRALFSAILSTASDQMIVTSGEKVREWTEGNRRYFQYESQVPIQKLVPFVSGRYEVLRNAWQGVPIEIYYHKGHDRNLSRILSGAQKGLDYASQNFSPYPYKSLRIVETPYVSEAISFPGGQINMGEKLAFLTKLNDNDSATVDSAFRYAVHEVAHQWWGHQVIPAGLKGRGLLTEALAEYTANQVYAKQFGQEALGLALRDNLNTYLQNRNKSDVPLLEASESHLVYQKGSLVLFALQDYLGEDGVNRILAKFLKDRAKVPPYPSSEDLVAALRQATPEKYQYLITDLFETVTLYNNEAESATVKKRPDGKYDVMLKLSAAKVRSDNNGNETPAEMNNEEIDVGIYNAAGKLIYLKKHPFKHGETELTITVDQPPQTAGIDPLHKLIDKVPDDNITNLKEVFN